MWLVAARRPKRAVVASVKSRKYTPIPAENLEKECMHSSQIVLTDAGPPNAVIDRGDGELHEIIPDELRIQWERESAEEHPKRGWGFES